MLAVGVITFKDTGKIYDIYTYKHKKVTRIDVLNHEGNRLIDKPIYGSYTTTKGSKYIGDLSLQNKIFTELDFIKEHTSTVKTDSAWIESVFVDKIICQDKDRTMQYIKENHNGSLYKQEFISPKIEYVEVVMDEDYNTDLKPVFFSEYIDITVEDNLNATIHSEYPYYTLNELRLKYDIDHLLTRDFKTITDEDELWEFIDELKDKPYIALDWETTTIDFKKGNKDAKITGLVLAYNTVKSRYIPFISDRVKTFPEEYLYKIIEIFKDRQKGGQIFIAHNAQFEDKVNIHYNFDFFMDYCTLVGSHLLNSDRKTNIHGLKVIGQRIFDCYFLSLTDIFKNKNQVHFETLPEDIVTAYACPDGISTIAAYEEQQKKLNLAEKAIVGLESYVLRITAEKEYIGVRVDLKAFQEEYECISDAVPRVENLFKQITQSEISLTSSAQVSNVLYNKLKRPILTYTNDGNPSTSNKVLEVLSSKKRDTPLNLMKEDLRDKKGRVIIKKADINNSLYPETVILSTYRKINKLFTAYFKPTSNRANNDRIHFAIKQDGTETGREASPAHQMPGRLKDCILPDSEDHIFLDTDYSAVEVRVLAWLSGQQDLIDKLFDILADIHRIQYSQMTGIEIWDISAYLRSLAKRMVFGCPYEISAKAMAEQFYGVGATKEQIREFQRAIDEYYNTYPYIKKLQIENHQAVLKHKKVCSYFGRPRHFNDIDKPGLSRATISRMMRQGNNMKIQGTAADLLKIAQRNIDQNIKQLKMDRLVNTPQGEQKICRLVLTIHDQTILSAHKKVPMVVYYDLLQRSMEIEIEGAPPFFAVPAVVNNMGDGKSDSYAIPGNLRDEMVADYRKYGKNSKWYVVWKDPVEAQRQISNLYREKEIVKYLEDLIAEHGLVDDLHTFVKHPIYTHDLLARFPVSKEYINKYGKPSHRESIKLAVESYLQYRQENDVKAIYEQEINPSDYKNVTSKKFEKISIVEDDFYSNLSYIDEEEVFDSDGNLAISTSEEEDADTSFYDEYLDEEYEKNIIAESQAKTPKYFILGDAIVIDTKHYNKKELTETFTKIDAKHSKDGIFSVQLLTDGKLIDTQRKLINVSCNTLQEMLGGEFVE